MTWIHKDKFIIAFSQATWIFYFVVLNLIQQYIKSNIPVYYFSNNIKLISWVSDRQSKDLGSNPSAVVSVFFSTERFQILQII